MDAQEVLKKLVSFDTVNDISTGKKAPTDCPRYINSILDELGFKTELIESDGYFTSLGQKGEGNCKILFLAHFDVVPVGENWDSDPFSLKLDGDKAYGRGTCDDKGNIVSMLIAAEKFSENEQPCTLMISASGDEEIGGRNGAGILKEELVKRDLFPDYVVIADGIKQQIIHRRRNMLPTSIKVKRKNGLLRARQETVKFTTETFGTNSRHSAYMRLGVDRHSMLAASKYLDLNPTSVVVNVRGAFLKSNVVPDWVELDIAHLDETSEEVEYDVALTALMRSLLAINQAPFPTRPSDKGTMIYPNILSLDSDIWNLYCDIRAMTNDGDSVKSAFQNALDGKLDLHSLTVSSGIGYVDVDPDSKLIRSARKILDSLGIKYNIIEGFGGSDSRYFAGHSAELFDFGPQGDNLHGPNEWVSMTSIEENGEFFYRLVEKETCK
ncbi:MAG: M20/M25/M40 family metallo-hydrolase [Candidatus Thorarchaeota archaeon]|jgi:succinyl-diaminopimelate desuccinylase